MPKPTLIYDGDCSFCMDAVYWLELRGADRTLAFRSYQSAPPQMALAGLTANDFQHAAYLVDDRHVDFDVSGQALRPVVFRGAAAVNYALRALPGFRCLGWRLLGYLYYVPGLRQVEDLGYAWVARNRHRFSRGCACGKSTPPVKQ